jgi:hypothetical protein
MSSDGSARVVVTALGANLGVAAAKFVAARLGPDELLVAGKIAVPSHADGADIATTIDDAEARVREALPSARIIYLEPDIYRPETTARSPHG